MRALLFFLRRFVISPEVVAALLPFLLCVDFPGAFAPVSSFVSSDMRWSFGVLAGIISIAIFCLNKIGDLLSPSGGRVKLLDWPDHSWLKLTVWVALTQVLVSFLISLVGFWVVLTSKREIGVAMMLCGLLAATVTALTIIFAYWESRQILRE